MAPFLTHSRLYALTLATLTLPYELSRAFIKWLLWNQGEPCCETVPSFAFPNDCCGNQHRLPFVYKTRRILLHNEHLFCRACYLSYDNCLAQLFSLHPYIFSRLHVRISVSGHLDTIIISTPTTTLQNSWAGLSSKNSVPG